MSLFLKSFKTRDYAWGKFVSVFYLFFFYSKFIDYKTLCIRVLSPYFDTWLAQESLPFLYTDFLALNLIFSFSLSKLRRVPANSVMDRVT